MKSKKDKEKLFEALRETPWISIACKRVGIHPSTFYRWKKEDPEFSSKLEPAIQAGRDNSIDFCESALMKKVAQGDLGAIKFALTHNHCKYQPIKAMPPIFDPEDLTNPVVRQLNRALIEVIKANLDQIKDNKLLGPIEDESI